MFTRAMFENQAAGAQAMANYYLRAQNWALALGLDSTPFAIVCDWNQCKAGAANFTRERAAGQRVYGGRRIFAGSTLRAAPSSIDADFIVQFRVKMGAGKRVDSLGKTLATGPARSDVVDVYMKWNGTMWRINGEYNLTKP